MRYLIFHHFSCKCKAAFSPIEPSSRSILYHTALIVMFAFILAPMAMFVGCTPIVHANDNATGIVDTKSAEPAQYKSALPTHTPSTSEETFHSQTPAPTPNVKAALTGKYLGIKGYGELSASEVKADGAKLYRFLVDGSERLFSLENSEDFSIQNRLYEGYYYEITAKNDVVSDIRFIGTLDESSPAPVSYAPGKRTLKNLLACAMQPVGSTLYVYGGGWNWQDSGASLIANRIGRPRTWRDFFIANDASYSYKDESSPQTSYYPFGGWCEYFYAGLDCSGYLGWTIYNTLETESGGSGYVFKSTDFAKTLSNMGFGSFSSESLERAGTKLQSGDIVSFNGHTYMVLGRCADGSLVIMHSSPTPSRSENNGGGVQLSAISADGKGGMALELIKRYSEKYFPEWYSRYENIAAEYSTYIKFKRSGNAGVFRWNIGNGGTLSDPDGILDMSAEEILKALFNE